MYVLDDCFDVSSFSDFDKQRAFLENFIEDFLGSIEDVGKKISFSLSLKLLKNNKSHEMKNLIWFRNQE